MPHSPRYYRGNLYICNLAEGEIVKVNLPAKKWDVIAQLPGFTRGMAFYENYIFVGFLKISEPCHQIYDLQIIQGKIRPNLLGIEDDLHYDTLVMSETVFWAKEKNKNT